MKLTKEQRKLFYTIMFPALIERVLVNLFHLIDSMMLGQMEGSTLAVAAVEDFFDSLSTREGRNTLTGAFY